MYSYRSNTLALSWLVVLFLFSSFLLACVWNVPVFPPFYTYEGYLKVKASLTDSGGFTSSLISCVRWLGIEAVGAGSFAGFSASLSLSAYYRFLAVYQK